jgi:Zn ribbon nucleic-acid-binding protein
MTAALAFGVIERLAPRTGKTDAPCPLCSTLHNPRRKVLRIWREEHFASFYCARCGEKGWARPGSTKAARPSTDRLAEIRKEAAEREAAEQIERQRTAMLLWSRRRFIEGTAAEIYLRQARGYSGQIPATLGYLPGRGKHGHAMIAPFGIATEPEPGLLAIAEDAVRGVHLTKLNADGTGKAEGESSAKIMVGKSAGFPICIAPPNDLLGMAITEGIEDAFSVHEATGLGAWAAGSAGRMPALADKLPEYIECVTICAHSDAAGQSGASALADALNARGIETILQGML